jgi:signal transduction histidine kinase
VHRAEESLQILLDVSEMLASSIDYEAMLANLPRFLVPRIADGCVVDVVTQDDAIRRIGVAVADSAKAAWAEKLKRVDTPEPGAPSSIRHMLEEGRARLTSEVTDEDLVAAARDATHLEILKALAPRSAMIVPMRARGRSIGLLWLYTMESGRTYGPHDLALAEDLARRAALAIDNARLYAEAQAAIRSRDIFLTVASHELRSPLTALQIQVHSMRRLAARAAVHPSSPPNVGHVREPLPAPARSLEKIAAKIEVAARQVARLTRLVDDLLDVSQIGAGRLRLRLERMDLVALVGEVQMRLEAQLAQSQCTLEISAHGPVVGMWDHSRLDQVLVNLLSNAMKYGPGEAIEIEVFATDTAARLCVRDHGIGIAPEDQARIFDRFERAVSDRLYMGLGMGLWIVRKIVAAHGGSIRVESRPGIGATFIVELPLRRPVDSRPDL